MKKKGFTLIELLAVIIVLAILAFILIPIIQDLIANARYASAVNSVMNYVKEANTQASLDVGGFEDFVLNTNELETGITDDELEKIKYKGKGPTYVYLSFDATNKYVSEGKFCIWGYSIDYSFTDGATRSDADYCSEKEPEGTQSCVVKNNNLYDATTNFTIKNVEDLVCVSEMSKTKSFLGKTIYLARNIDINNSSSYNNPNTTEFGDINGNGEIEGLKIELTTGQGFYPIGLNTAFRGTFEGYAKSISNLMVNRNQDNIGFISQHQGVLKGLTLNSNITGKNRVGGVVGRIQNGGVIREIIYDGVVTGNGDFIGGVIGYISNSNNKMQSILVKNIVLNTSSAYRGGIVSGTDTTTGTQISAIIENGTLPSSTSIGKGQGGHSSYAVYGSSTVVGGNSGDGSIIYTSYDEMLNAYDKVLDTYIGGDNDNSGYYFDYENASSSNIVLKTTEKDPINFTLKGSGTNDDPYIIDNYKHFKEATIKSNGNFNFKITADIDFTDRHYYALGTNGNILGSNIDGDMHKLSNISFGCAENCGLVSQNSKTIEGLKLENITLTSDNNDVGALVGKNTGTIKGITATNINVTGKSHVGGLVGTITNGGKINEVIFDGTVTGTGTEVAGVVGNLSTANNKIKSIMVKNVNLNASNPHRAGILGYGDTMTGTDLSGVIERGNFSNSCGMGFAASGTIAVYGTENVINGTLDGGVIKFTLNDEILSAYDKVLDTYIGGDNDNDGYYFDYENESSSNIIIKSTKHDPITFTLSGSGTNDDPYIIDNYEHFKEATTKTKENYKFKITNDIDFNGKHYYALGTNGNLLGSNIDGDMHTLSNISFSCAENCGLISQNTKTIEGLNLSNITISSTNNNVGGLVGYNKGVIKGINVDNINVTGYDSVGGLVGAMSNGATINEVSFDGTVTSTGTTSTGGIVGTINAGYNQIKNILMRNIILNSSGVRRAGIVGSSDTYTGTVMTGVVENGRFSHTTAMGYGGTNPSTLKIYASNLPVNGTTDGGLTRYTLIPPTTVSVSGAEIDSLTYYDNVGVLDTVIGGDNDNSGYYFQYNNSADSIIVVKAGAPSNPSNPGTTTPDSPVAITGTPTGTNPPTCVLNQVIPRSNGIQAVLTCEDEEGAPTIRSQWNVNAGAPTNTFADIGIVKNGTVNGNSKTVRPYWSTSDPISVPHKGDCYYYRFGAQDASGNWTYYVTNECYHAFLD